MGAKLEKIYKIVEEKTGTVGRMKLAQLTKISKNDAIDMPDTQEAVTRFIRIAQDIVGKNIEDLLK